MRVECISPIILKVPNDVSSKTRSEQMARFFHQLHTTTRT
jgi:hypothetical protein